MAKKKKTKDSSNNSSYSVELTGLILILIGVIGFGFGFILVASHFEFLKITGSPKEILMETYNNYMERISTITASNALNTSGVTTIVIGGGFIGALFTAALYGLFGKTGTIVILVLLVLALV